MGRLCFWVYEIPLLSYLAELQKVRRKIKQSKTELDKLANTEALSDEDAKKKQELEESLTKYRHYYVYIKV